MATARELIQSVQQSPFMQKMTPEHLIHQARAAKQLVQRTSINSHIYYCDYLSIYISKELPEGIQ